MSEQELPVYDVAIGMDPALDLTQRLEVIIQARFADMTAYEHTQRMELAALDPDTARGFWVHEVGDRTVVDWPQGCELLAVSTETLKAGL